MTIPDHPSQLRTGGIIPPIPISQPVVKDGRRTEGAETRRRPGATTENTGPYLRKKQRSRRGCIGGRMQPAFHHRLPGLATEALVRLRTAADAAQ